MEQIRQIIKRLLDENTEIKLILKNLGNELEQEKIDRLLDRLSQNNELIEKLRKGL
ncbi:hypothetical protein LAG90_15555 [Marinilongibacter aquaticus]|uniref:hypothetical protein n=1 Tax=Marinilongibacter aquaticus TaxID=2975157 RepID=UPI0021BD7F05|nr:hypothetical protein [Marinilongibacter aquaticus]UBM58219.1 hypothetical protein LAG90_15555 [Marinilongibacter aquaticus]